MRKRQEMIKQRLGIFCFYDKEGVVSEYVEYLLNSLSKELTHLVIVVNGFIREDNREKLSNLADFFLVRPNNGFDAGAYRDVICNKFGKNRIKEYDELVLCNDTFYGPFISFELIFSKMQNNTTDFWGLNYIECDLLSHIQSYFLVFRKDILQDDEFYRYLDKKISDDSNNISDIYVSFECGLFIFLKLKGYKYNSYAKNDNFDIYRSPNHYIRESNLPILKRKAFSEGRIIRNNILDALKCISSTSYNLDIILCDIKRVYNIDITRKEINQFNEAVELPKIYQSKIKPREIERFLSVNHDIYIYGTGTMALAYSRILSDYLNNLKGYIISDSQIKQCEYFLDKPVYKLSDIIKIDKKAILVALNSVNTAEVKKDLNSIKNVLYIC